MHGKILLGLLEQKRPSLGANENGGYLSHRWGHTSCSGLLCGGGRSGRGSCEKITGTEVSPLPSLTLRQERRHHLCWSLPADGKAAWSTLIGRGMSRLVSHWSRASLQMLAPAVLCHKERARASKAPYQGLWDANFACSWLVLYGIKINGFHARKGPIIGALVP